MEGARVVLAEVRVGATGRYFAFRAHDEGPIFKKFAVLESPVHGVREESRGPDGVVPTGEELQDMMLGDSRAREEFRTRGSATRFAGHGGQGIQNVLFVRRWFQGAFDVY